MVKAGLVTAMAEKSGLSKKDCEAALDAFISSVGDALKSGDKVKLLDFGTFAVKERAARTGRNPRTMETVEISASKAPVFKPGKALKKRCNKENRGGGNIAKMFPPPLPS